MQIFVMKYNLKILLKKRKDKDGNLIVEQVPLLADISFAGKRMYYYTGYKVDARNFDPASNRIKKNTSGYEGKKKVPYNIMNGRFLDIEKTIKDLFQNAQSTPEMENIRVVLDKVCLKRAKMKEISIGNGFFAAFDSYIEKSNMSQDRKKHVQSALNHWKRFEDFKKTQLSFDTITPDTLKEFEKYLLYKSTKARSRKSEEQVPSPMGKNTVCNIMKMTRAFWNDSRKKNLTSTYPFAGYQIPAEVYGTPIYITKEERDRIYNAVIENEQLSRVRDIFIFQCLIGVRVGDLLKLTRSNIQGGILSYIPRKTKEGKPVTVTVPLTNTAMKILSKYDLPGGMLLPFISEMKYNGYLKELFRLETIKLDRFVVRLNPRTREPEEVRLCDIASSHLARRTFIGNLYGKVESEIIASMSGHVQGSKAFARYHDVSIELQRGAVALLE